MYTKEPFRSLTHSVVCRIAIAALGATATLTLGWAAQGQDGSDSPSLIPEASSTESRIPDALKTSIRTVVVIAGQSPPSRTVTGSYAKETAGLVGGMDAGSRIGTVSKEISGVPVSVRVIPGLAIPGAIFGGVSGLTKAEIQDFRDRLTKEIARAESTALTNDGLAMDVYWSIHRLPHLDSQLFAPSVQISADTDAELYVSFDDLTIDVQGKEAIMTTSAVATLRRLSDGRNVYKAIIQYQDRDTLSNWTKNDNALWQDYTNFARYYLGREISAEIFDRVVVSHELHPSATKTAKQARKDKRKFVSRSLTPTLAWKLTLDGGDAQNSWADTIDESDIYYDIEIFDDHQLVYYEENISDPHHTIAFDLEACVTYRWSVRPAYHLHGEIKFGEWMRIAPKNSSKSASENEGIKGVFGRQASAASAYTQDFALLEIDCRRR